MQITIDHGGALCRCGYTSNDTPDAVKWENIRGIDSLQDRLSYLWQRIDTDNAPELVLIDGIGDFVADPNDSEECTSLVYRLCSVCHNREIGVLLSLHNNPTINNQKARGVLGSELWRKCESTLIIEKLEDGIRRSDNRLQHGKTECIRHGFILNGMMSLLHVSCDAPAARMFWEITKQRESVLELMKPEVYSQTESAGYGKI